MFWLPLLQDTITKRRALRYAMNGKSEVGIREAVCRVGRKNGLVVHVYKDGPAHLLIWAETKAPHA